MFLLALLYPASLARGEPPVNIIISSERYLLAFHHPFYHLTFLVFVLTVLFVSDIIIMYSEPYYISMLSKHSCPAYTNQIFNLLLCASLPLSCLLYSFQNITLLPYGNCRQQLYHFSLLLSA